MLGSINIVPVHCQLIGFACCLILPEDCCKSLMEFYKIILILRITA